MSSEITYLDNNASTRVDPRVLDAMLPYLTDLYGNPSSQHHFGAQVAARIEDARASVARTINARPAEIIFLSGGTEANNTAFSSALAARPDRRRVVISAVEHHSVLEPAEALEREGIEVRRIGVNRFGALNLDQLADALTPACALVSIMHANNETGAVFPIRQVADIAHRHGALLHCDAVNALGKIPVHVDELGVDLLSISAHKIHGPKGCGALYVRRGTPFKARQLGGPQERQRRGGTHNAAGIIGFGRACELCDESEWPRIGALRDRLEQQIVRRIPTAHVIAAEVERTCNTSCVCFAGVGSEAVLLLLSEAGVCVSSGAACSSGALEASHVLRAMDIDPTIAQGQVRFSLSRYSTDADIARVLELLPGIIERVASVNV